MVPTRFKDLLEQLVKHRVDFILIGGLAGVAHGASRVTVDLDVVYSREDDNIHRLVESLKVINPYLRGAPPGLPFKFDEPTVKRGLNFTLSTDWGALDLLGDAAGGGNYQALLPHSQFTHFYEIEFRVIDLDALIRLKRAAGRTKDFEAIAELESLRIQRNRSSEK